MRKAGSGRGLAGKVVLLPGSGSWVPSSPQEENRAPEKGDQADRCSRVEVSAVKLSSPAGAERLWRDPVSHSECPLSHRHSHSLCIPGCAPGRPQPCPEHPPARPRQSICPDGTGHRSLRRLWGAFLGWNIPLELTHSVYLGFCQSSCFIFAFLKYRTVKNASPGELNPILANAALSAIKSAYSPGTLSAPPASSPPHAAQGLTSGLTSSPTAPRSSGPAHPAAYWSSPLGLCSHSHTLPGSQRMMPPASSLQWALPLPSASSLRPIPPSPPLSDRPSCPSPEALHQHCFPGFPQQPLK